MSLLCSSVLASPPQSDLEGRRKALNDLIAERWEYVLRNSPLYASILGDKRWNDKLDDFSQKAIDDDLEQSKKFLARFETIDTTGFPEQEALNKILMVRDLRMDNEKARFKFWEMPVSQIDGVHTFLPQLVSVFSFQSVKDYEDYISRLKQFPRLFNETMVQMRKGMAEGLMPPTGPSGESGGAGEWHRHQSARCDAVRAPFLKVSRLNFRHRPAAPPRTGIGRDP